MSKQFESITPHLKQFIEHQQMYFVATAATEGRVNLSPKGMDSFRVLDANRITWLNLTGSGNETAAHLLDNPRMTIMFCSFESKPLILRLYGEAKAVHEDSDQWQEMCALFPASTSTRQIYDMQVDMVQTSCGFGVPRYEFQQQRPTLTQWAENKSRDDVRDYWREKNLTSIDGFDTGLSELLMED